MIDKSTTIRSSVEIKVSEFGEGTPWIALEVSATDFPVLRGGFLGLELKPGTTYEQAREIARHLRQHVLSVSATIFHPQSATDSTH